ncbi:MAG: hypothetical protein LUQ38_02605 [Methanotrichaceae archaeon]|nr:hypothetical protein [Methanotrichaceae archaeon]
MDRINLRGNSTKPSKARGSRELEIRGFITCRLMTILKLVSFPLIARSKFVNIRDNKAKSIASQTHDR